MVLPQVVGREHADPIVNEVKVKVLQTNPDGTVKSESATGGLVYRVHNLGNGKAVDVDAGGSALIVFHPDGSFDYYIHGPVIGLFPAGAGNLPRGLYADGHKTLSLRGVSVTNVCDELT